MQSVEERKLRDILRKNPGSLLELLQLGKLLIDKGRLEGASGALPILLRAVMRMESGHPLAGSKWGTVTEVYLRLGREKRALIGAQKALMLSSIRDREIQRRMWRVIRDACERLNLSLMWNEDAATPSKGDILATLAEAFNQLGEYDRAVDIGGFIDETLNAPSPRAFNAIGYAYRELGNTEASERAYAFAQRLFLKENGYPKPTLRKTMPPKEEERKTS
ncbi:hypothetical protein KJZ71_00790 [Patescibacteria group bacterium]|uniref:Tetratricopeptide repeat protein n=1 Tax=candidate division WWE3 bacterium TaxID=2053526 RepID=A0A928Y6A9_UNCKA|nr:hypothetical protein [candidate division WWE3 bacterium]MCL4732326.1 hypothetical protein [Patescibacteria group bacterium]MDL1953206.1 hypothetical protein [Candidatus Uhrbacteria bacterium UHB]RIL00988.1 MAG: hypothetical protein DCC77_00385 [Candidatus Uhrbacteria bacterium]